MDIKKIKRLIELLEASSLAEIEIKEGEESVRLSRQTQYASMPSNHDLRLPLSYQAPAPMPTADQSTEISAHAPSHTISLTGHMIHSPMVGTFYAASSPDNPPFVKVGQTVNAGQVLGIIEAMKMFNEIESDRSGTIIEILINNGDPVEYDQPLFVIE
jgi:acetyl-CoA carboxylase biotin carboxyl carrier protein